MDWRVRVYDAGAGLYGFLTSHRVWLRANHKLVRHFPHEVARICDLGCGAGATVIAEAQACPTAEVTGVDISRKMIDRAERAVGKCDKGVRERIRLLTADAAHLPFEEATFDVVTGHSFLYLVPDRSDVLREVVRVLRPGGRAVFMEPRAGGFSPSDVLAMGKDPRFLASMSIWRVISGYSKRFTANELLEILAEAGLRPIGTEDVLGGLGVICCAEKPTTSSRIA